MVTGIDDAPGPPLGIRELEGGHLEQEGYGKPYAHHQAEHDPIANVTDLCKIGAVSSAPRVIAVTERCDQPALGSGRQL